MHKSLIRRCGAVLCLLGMLFCLAAAMLPMITRAAGEYSLTLVCRSSDVTLSGMQWNIYPVGERTEQNSFRLTGDFAGYPVSMDNLSSTSDLQDAADTLENYAVLDKIAPLNSGETDENGMLRFDALAAGVYLIAGKSVTVGDTQYIPSPSLLEVSESGETFDIMTYPKIEKRKTGSSDETIYTVTKIWIDDEEDLSVRPDSVVLGLYCNEELDREITLSEENDWSYTWSSDASSVWSIKEMQVPENYGVVYRENETQYVVVNTYNKPETPVTTSSTTVTASSPNNSSSGSEKLPQTGQLWWPVPILTACGLIFIFIGIRLRAKNR